LLNGRYTLDSLTLNEEIIHIKVSDFINTDLYDSKDTSTSSVLYPTITSPYTTNIYSTPSILSSTISPSSTLTSTLVSHIELLILLSSTKEKQLNRLTDKVLSFKNDELLDYFLNWLIFLNRDIKTIKDQGDRKKVLSVRKTLGELGIQDFRFRLKYESLHRVFNQSSFDKGGRFAGATHLNLLKHMRGFIHINGEPTVEWDYDEFHVRMLYHLRGLDITEDAYDSIEGPEDRDIKKKALLTAINAPTEKTAIGAIRKDMIDAGIRGEILKDKYIKDLLARTKKAHPLIADDIGTGKGIFLQNIDSNIADAILTNLMKKNIPVLPVHDSFIVPQQFEDELRRQMNDEYEKILKFKPGITKKEKRYCPKKWCPNG